MLYLIIEILLSIIIASIPALLYLKKKDKYKKYLIIGSILLLVGSLIRLLFIDKLPAGLNQDEASIGYDAWAILNYGIDRAGNSYPVHLNAWGSGQNALYAYLLMPLIKIFGLNSFSVRLPSAVLSSITLVVAYFLFKKEFLAISINSWFTLLAHKNSSKSSGYNSSGNTYPTGLEITLDNSNLNSQ